MSLRELLMAVKSVYKWGRRGYTCVYVRVAAMLDAVINPLTNTEENISFQVDIQSSDHMNLERIGNGVS